jgi:hypothetical protein
MAVEYVETKQPFEEELKTALQHETEEAEPKLIELIEFARELMLKSTSQNGEIKSEKTPYMKADVRAEQVTGLTVNPEITKAIEQFGADMLEEAFECLGEAGVIFLELFMSAKTTAIKIDICEALEELVDKIARKATYQFEDEDKNTFRYSPIRLAPKLIGVHPDNLVATTCLGKSILTASFFAKAGVPVLHGGVILSAQDDVLIIQAETIRQIQTQANHPDHTILITLDEDLESVRKRNVKIVRSHNGFHAATYAKIAEDSWMQFDPNYGSARIMYEDADYLTRAHNELSTVREASLASAEVRLMLGTSGEYFFTDLAREMGAALLSPQEIDELLLYVPSSEVYSAIIEKVFLPILPSWITDMDGDGTKEQIKRGIDIALRPAREGKILYIQLTIARILENHVFPDAKEGDILDSIERCKTDAAYRQRRVEDLCTLPLMMVLTLESGWFDFKKTELGSGGLGHPCIDLGLPEHRIGISVLSDIAVHYGDELPLSVWLAHWPSDVSLAEHYNQTPTDTQRQLARRSIKHATQEGVILTYSAIHDILRQS